MGIQNRVGVNNRVEVPRDRLGEATLRLQDQGVLGAGDFNYGIMGDAVGFGTTDNHARQLYNAQLAANIRRILMENPRVSNALVIVSQAETSPFRIHANASQATATITLTLRGGGRLAPTEAQAVAELVRTSVPGILLENISITDSDFYHYRITGDADQDLDVILGHRLSYTNRLNSEFKMQVEQMLQPIFGLENIRVQPNVKINWDNMTTDKVEFDPPIPGEMDGIIRSMEHVHEMSRRWLDAEGIPGTDTNAMGTAEYPWGPLDENDVYRRTIISNNYDINQTITQIEHAAGTISELTIGIFINALAEGAGEDFTAEIAETIATTLGISTGRISVRMIPFSHVDTSLEEMFERQRQEEIAARNRELFNTILMYATIILLGVMVMLLGRSIVRAVTPPPEPEPMLIAAGPDGIDFIIDDDTEIGDRESALEEIDLHSKSPGLEQIERFIDKDSASVAQLLRNWLSDE